ncbi:hypothetical protein L211DRAFT_826933 [Terfezia boudieri ATCC MYA-4762]|uniref:ferric-chelate reductase (NADPH) n=1 Tax=Terfezia boudieri ATCC MYA-4762 TaxID=1051890 RepID=A0A3N4LNY5_9PEZI|nr:hypothetical protein L211DRAFT_826933 [Terfezia boudieri ATCC MYA-4762]
MSHSLLNNHGLSTKPTGYWRPGKPASYGSLEIPTCIGEETCDYWENYYIQHNRHVLLMFITWGLIAFILLVAAFITRYPRIGNRVQRQAMNDEEESSTAKKGSTFQVWSASCRRHLLPKSHMGILLSMTRLQALLVVLLFVYAILFSFIGIAYKEWVDPTKQPGHRIGFNEFVGNRTGCLAFALVPLVFVLASRDNIFSLITGISYQNFNLLHRWVGRCIFIFTFAHALLWSVELGFTYQRQPTHYRNKGYLEWGVCAAVLATYLILHSLSVVRKRTGYEFFKKTHKVVAILFLGACWGHWRKMREWMIAGVVIVFLDRAIRYARVFFIHMNWASSERGPFGLRSFEGTISRHYDAEDNIDTLVLRLPKATVKYDAGQHFFLTFPTMSLFESHPFTPASVRGREETGIFYEQLYIIRVCDGQTKRLAKYCKDAGVEYPMPSVCSGPYGSPNVLDEGAENVQLIAGGTGVSFTLPIAINIVAEARQDRRRTAARRVDFVWIVRRKRNVDWIRDELNKLKRDAHFGGVDLHIKIVITRDCNKSEKEVESTPTSPVESVSGVTGIDIEKEIEIQKLSAEKEAMATTSSVSSAGAEQETDWLQDRHPQVGEIVKRFWEQRCIRGRVQVLACGPPSMASELRGAIAGCNVPEMVKRGEERGAVGYHWDAREY